MLAQVAAPASAIRAHEEMFAYWASLRSAGRLPARADIDPGRFKRHLPTVSLIDVIRGEKLDFRIRLAGTALYGLHSREITGLTVVEAYGPRDAPYWTSELEKVVTTARPAAGLRPLPGRDSDALSVMWLRLPLASNGAEVDMILGYDAVIGDPRYAPTGIRAA